MHWEVLIIPLIALGVWILGTIFRGEEERPGSPMRRGPAGRPPQRRPVTDLDQFLEEARRRREAAQRQTPMPPPRPTTTPRPAPPPRRPARERPTAAPVSRASRPVPRPVEALPVAVPVPSAEPIPVAEIVRPGKGEADPIFKVTSLAESRGSQETATSLTEQIFKVTSLVESRGRKETVSPLTEQVRNMLRQPQSAALAFILHEILDRPLSRRR